MSKSKKAKRAKVREFGELLGWSPELESAYWEIMANAVKVGDCFLYTGQPTNRGYGYAKVRGEFLNAHVIVLRRTAGRKPDSKHEAGHLCGNKECVNPEHLAWISKSENCRMREYAKFMRGLASRIGRGGVDFPGARLTEPLPTTLNLAFFSDAMDLSALFE